MTSFKEQIDAAKVAHRAATALEKASRAQIAETFDLWDTGELNAITVRYRLERIVRESYRTSAALAVQHASLQSGLPDWLPSRSVFNTPYLKDLLKDIRRNLRDYKAGQRDISGRRRAVLRMQHSAGVAAERGYTDALIASYIELEDFGFRLRKFWLANFVDNVPCGHCRALHGTEVGLREEFPIPRSTTLKIYRDLLGPPRHPRCHCKLVILIVTLENALETPDIEDPPPAPETMTSEEVRGMSGRIFRAVIKALMATIKFLTGRK